MQTEADISTIPWFSKLLIQNKAEKIYDAIWLILTEQDAKDDAGCHDLQRG